MTIEHWIGMDTHTQQARQRKAYNIRLCRHYLRRALDMGLSEKATTVRFWRAELALWQAEPVWQIAEQLQKEA